MFAVPGMYARIPALSFADWMAVMVTELKAHGTGPALTGQLPLEGWKLVVLHPESLNDFEDL
jgi:hypothetical protein